MIAFGPVPSRRLGRSLGINPIPPKTCTYSCVYCQLGRTSRMQAKRQAFYEPGEVLRAVQARVTLAQAVGETVDYLAFVPDGEPTLDVHLGREIELLAPMNLPIAVISNASLIGWPDAQADLAGADWVSLKVDAVQEQIWRRIDRPHASLNLRSILEGALCFAQCYKGHLVTETMLVAGVNDAEGHLAEIAAFLAQLQPECAYLSVPTRPPAEAWARPPDAWILNRAYQVVRERVELVECLTGYEGSTFAFTGDVEEDLLSITAVHPMREDAVADYLARAGAGWPLVEQLVAQDRLVETEYKGHTFYLKKLGSHSKDPQ